MWCTLDIFVYTLITKLLAVKARPFVSEEVEDKILAMLKESIPVKLQPEFVTNKERKLFHKQVKENKLPEVQNEEHYLRKKLRSELALGINCVTKALEKDELRLVIITRESKVKVLLQHILPLVGVRNCPALRLPNLSENLYTTTGIQSLAAIGFKKKAEKSHFDDFVKFSVDNAPPITLSWLQDAQLTSDTQADDKIHQNSETNIKGETSVESMSFEDSESKNIPATSVVANPKVHGFKKDYSYLYIYKKEEKMGDDFISLTSNIKTDEDYFPTDSKKKKIEKSKFVSMKYQKVNVKAMKKNENRKKKKKTNL